MDQITDITVREMPKFNRDSTVTVMMVYTYYVGKHGPFTLQYVKGQDAPVTVKADMQSQVQKLMDTGVTLS